jgi:N-methylhydantoinase A/oxoprolinase/acetone carboxylase beta subunit
LPIKRVIVPTTPGTMCALGCLVADLRAAFVATLWRDCADMSTSELREPFATLDVEARAWLADQSVPVSQTFMIRSADMCYVGQSFDVNVPLPGTLEDVGLPDAIERFHQRHISIYGHADPAAAVRLMTVRVQVVGATLGQMARMDPIYVRSLAVKAQRPNVRAAALRLVSVLEDVENGVKATRKQPPRSRKQVGSAWAAGPCERILGPATEWMPTA